VATPLSTKDGEQVPTTREQLLRAVIAIAGEQGLSHVTYRSVAARANVAHGLVRHYFGTRQAMLDEALEKAMAEDISAVTLATGDPGAFGEGLFTIEDEAVGRRVLQFDVVLNAIRGVGDKRLAYRVYDRYLTEIMQTLDSLGIDDPDGSWADLIFVALDGLALQQALYRDSERTAAVLERLRAVLARLGTQAPTSHS
jgi:AcrR family transcriptional regulator